MNMFDTPVKSRLAVVETLHSRMLEGIGEGWTDVLKNADDILYNICEQLYRRGCAEVVCPQSNDVFRAFRECKFSNLKVVWVLQDPYHQVINGTRVADGIAMSCRNTGILQPSLKLVYDEIGRTYGETERCPDLMTWSRQGVLMFNTALTVAQGKPGSHTDIWRPFTQYLLKELSQRCSKLLYIFSGANAKSFSNFASGTKYFTVHPAAAAYNGGQWNSENLFNDVNYVLQNRGQDPIVW